MNVTIWAWLLSSPSLASRQDNMAGSCLIDFSFIRKALPKSKIFGRVENFQDNCYLPWTIFFFLNNSYSSFLTFLNAMITLVASRSDRLTEIYFSSNILKPNNWHCLHNFHFWTAVMLHLLNDFTGPLSIVVQVMICIRPRWSIYIANDIWNYNPSINFWLILLAILRHVV